MGGALIVKEELKGGVIDLLVHDHGLKHRPLTDDKLDHPVYQHQQLDVSGDHYTHQ